MLKKAFVFISGFAISLTAQGQPTYDVQSLPWPETSSFGTLVNTGPSGVNGEGQISDFASYEAGGQTAPVITLPLLYENGQFQVLPVVPSLGDSAQPNAIAGNGFVAGVAWDSQSPFVQFPVLWKNGFVTPLALAIYNQGAALYVNDFGQVAGYVSHTATSDATSAAWWDQAGVLHDLGNFGGSSAVVRSINNSGKLLIEVEQSGGPNQVLLWDNGVSQAITGATHGAVALNDKGHVVYTGVSAGGLPTFYFWNSSTAVELPALPGDLGALYFSLNDQDQAVGTSMSFGGNGDPSRAILWDDGTLYDLNSLLQQGSGWNLTRADAIGPDGSIIGEGYDNGQFEFFLATPNLLTPDSSGPVPEPASLALLAFGSAILFRRRK